MMHHGLILKRLLLASICSGALALAGAADGLGVEVSLQLAGSGFNAPVLVTHAPDDTTRLFVVEQPGVIRVIKNGVTLTNPFLDISAQTLHSGERGLLGLAFHPQYPSVPYFYVYYSALGGGAGGHSRLSRFQVSANPDVAIPSSEYLMLSQDQPEPNHNGGMIAFGPLDNYLYIGFGDGGGAGDDHGTTGNSQDIQTWLGKMLRIDVDGSEPYDVPFDNPNLGGLPEIWSTGLRNPWRWSFDRETGDMYIGDVGQYIWEELDFEPAGGPGGINWGWRLREGAHCFNPATNCDTLGLTTDPIYEFDHSGGRCSVTGGYVYRGCAIPELRGTYFFGDYCSGEVWSFNYDGAVQNFRIRFNLGLVSSFGEDANGELYICQLSGEIYKIIPQSPPALCGGCCDLPGDADSNAKINIGDVTFLITRIFSGGPAPECQDSGDVDASGSINIGDVTVLIAYIFTGGKAPICGTAGF